MKLIWFILLQVFFLLLFPTNLYAFTRVTDISLGGATVTVGNLEATFETIKANIKANKTIKGERNKLPTMITLVHGRQVDPTNIQIEINTSQLIATSKMDGQLPISNQGFLNAVQESISLFENVPIADIMFKPLKFTSTPASPDDGRNVLLFRPIESVEGIASGAGGASVSIINVAKTENIIFMGQKIMVKPGTLLDVDVVFDPPDNDPCLFFEIHGGDYKIGGNPNAVRLEPKGKSIDECKNPAYADVGDFAVRGIARVLGLESSAIASSAFSRSPVDMTKYKFTNDDEIGLANLYPKTAEINKTRGTINGKVVINKKPHIGVHVVLEDLISGEPVASAFTDIEGDFEIRAIPEGTYSVYTEPLDGRVRPTDFVYNSFASNAKLDFATAVFPEPITIKANMTTSIRLEFEKQPRSAFNLNTQIIPGVFTEQEAIDGGLGVTPIPIRIRPGQRISKVRFWGDNISTDFGTLSITGDGITLSNIENEHNFIGPPICEDCEIDETTGKVVPEKCPENPFCPPPRRIAASPDKVPGITADITASPDAKPGPRSIIFTGDKLDTDHPSFGLRDQLTGAIIIREE